MDFGHDWHKTFPSPFDDHMQEAKLVCHSDGGSRKDSCSATGWMVEAIVIRNGLRHTFRIAMSGKFISPPISSFLAESIALDEAGR